MKFYYYIVYQATFTFIDENEDLAGDVMTNAAEVVLNDPIKSIEDINLIKNKIMDKVKNEYESNDNEEDINIEEIVILSWQLLRMEEIII